MPALPSILNLVARLDVPDDLSVLVVRYIIDFQIILDAGLFATMSLSWDVQSVRDEWKDPEHDSTACDLKKPWWHWGGHGAPELSIYSSIPIRRMLVDMKKWGTRAPWRNCPSHMQDQCG